jgi:hypothetical protein
MSTYPENPYWDPESDGPIIIMDRQTWDEAEASGHITPEHRLHRVRNMMMNAVDLTDGNAAYDEDGFHLSLTADAIQLEGGVELHVYAGDHPPAHVHIKVNAKDAEVIILLETGGVRKDTRNGKLKAKEVRKLQDIVTGPQSEALAVLWAKNGPDRDAA